MSGITPVEIRGWDDYWAEKGSGLSLLYLTPESGVCKNDDKAYRQIIGIDGIAESNFLTNGGIGLPTKHRRISDRVWEANIVLAQDAVIGDLIPKTLSPCDGRGVEGQYRLSAVSMWQDGASLLRSAAIAAQDSGEGVYIDEGSGNVSGPGDFVSKSVTGNTVGENVQAVSSATSSLFWHLLVPVGVLAGVIFLASRKV